MRSQASACRRVVGHGEVAGSPGASGCSSRTHRTASSTCRSGAGTRDGPAPPRPSAAACGSRCRSSTGRRRDGRRPSAGRAGVAAARRSAASAAGRGRAARGPAPWWCRTPACPAPRGRGRPGGRPRPGRARSSRRPVRTRRSAPDGALEQVDQLRDRVHVLAREDGLDPEPSVAQPFCEREERCAAHHQRMGVEAVLLHEQVVLDQDQAGAVRGPQVLLEQLVRQDEPDAACRPGPCLHRCTVPPTVRECSRGRDRRRGGGCRPRGAGVRPAAGRAGRRLPGPRGLGRRGRPGAHRRRRRVPVRPRVPAAEPGVPGAARRGRRRRARAATVRAGCGGLGRTRAQAAARPAPSPGRAAHHAAQRVRLPRGARRARRVGRSGAGAGLAAAGVGGHDAERVAGPGPGVRTPPSRPRVVPHRHARRRHRQHVGDVRPAAAPLLPARHPVGPCRRHAVAARSGRRRPPRPPGLARRRRRAGGQRVAGPVVVGARASADGRRRHRSADGGSAHTGRGPADERPCDLVVLDRGPAGSHVGAARRRARNGRGTRRQRVGRVARRSSVRATRTAPRAGQHAARPTATSPPRRRSAPTSPACSARPPHAGRW